MPYAAERPAPSRGDLPALDARRARSEPAPALEGPVALTPSARERIILENYSLVCRIAGRLARRLPAHVEVDELVNVGILGLIDAVDRFEGGRGVPFRSYAATRIRGAMVDALRSADWTPRAVHRTGGQIEAKRIELRRALGREPSRAEMASGLEVGAAHYDRLVARSAKRALVSLDAPVDDDGSALLVDLVADDTTENIVDAWVSAERQADLADAIDQLCDRERQVVLAYYQTGLPLKEIGAMLGVTESRVCQLHVSALKRLQKLLRTEAA